MASVVNGPDFQYAVVLPSFSDTEDNAVGACGIHNASTGVQSVSVIFGSGPETPVVMRFNSGESLFCWIKRIRATGTTIAPADLRVLY